MANTTNRVTVSKSFTIPKFSTQQDSAKFPSVFRTSQTYRFDVDERNDAGEVIGSFQVTGTIKEVFVVNDATGNPMDIIVDLSPIWYYDGPDYAGGRIELSQVSGITQMFISMTQDKARPTLPNGATQYHFTINNHPVDSDDVHFLKVVIRKDEGEYTDKTKNTTSVYGRISSVYYNEDKQTQVIVLSAMEMIDGRVSYYRAEIDVSEIIGIYRYCIECKKLERKPREDADGDILPEPVEVPTTGKKAKKSKAVADEAVAENAE